MSNVDTAQSLPTLDQKAAPRFELGVRALQAPALPLGHAARDFGSEVLHLPMLMDKKSSHSNPAVVIAAFICRGSAVW